MKIRSKAQNFGRVWLVRALAREYDFYDANNKQIASDATLLVKLGNNRFILILRFENFAKLDSPILEKCATINPLLYLPSHEYLYYIIHWYRVRLYYICLILL
jgi:hypothetical protein